MRPIFLLFALLLVSGPALAGPKALDGDPAQRIASISAGRELPADDARVLQAAAWLKQAAAATGEEEMAVAAASFKVAHYLYDITRVRAEPLEVLEALAKFAPPGRPMSDTTGRYVEARRTSAGKTHAEAMAALAHQ